MAHVAMATDFPDSDAAVELGRLLGERLAWCHALRLWAWGIDQDRVDGTFKLEPERIAEIASYRGDPRRFVDAMITVGLLEQRPDDSLYMNGWRRNQEYFAKKRRMREYRKNQRERASGGADVPSEAPRDTPRVASRDTSRVPRSPSPSPSLKKEDGFSLGVDQVVAHYLQHHPRRAVQANKAANKIRARLKEGYSVQQLCDAIDGNAASSWHVENDHTHIDQIVSSAKKVDLFVGKLAKARDVDGDTHTSVAPMASPTPAERAASIEASRRAMGALNGAAPGVAP